MSSFKRTACNLYRVQSSIDLGNFTVLGEKKNCKLNINKEDFIENYNLKTMNADLKCIHAS